MILKSGEGIVPSPNVRKGEVMYTIDSHTLKSILKRKFSSLVGSTLEEVDKFQKDYKLSSSDVASTKHLVKKLHYEAMREIQAQIEAFSKGVNIGVTLQKPTSSDKME